MKQIVRFSVIVLMLVPAMLTTGCATTANTAKNAGASPDLFGSLQIGQTTRQEVILKLGQPSASFEHDSILTYRVGHAQKLGYYIISPPTLWWSSAQGATWAMVHYSLVLVFDGNGVLQKQNLVPVQ